MAERLTRKIVKTIQDKYSLGNYLYYDFAEIDDTNKLLNKLGKLEDIMDKYGIESIELLEHIIKKGKVIISVIEDFAKEEYDKMKQDRDTWKRACELAVLWIAQELKVLPKNIKKSEFEFEDEMIIEENTNYFYQQAKKEGEHGN